MKNIPFIQIFFLLIAFVFLNVWLIPTQKISSATIQEHWRIPLDSTVQFFLGSTTINCIHLNKDSLQIVQLNSQTGATLQSKTFFKRGYTVPYITCIQNNLYLALPKQKLYKLNATTLTTLWEIDWAFSFTSMDIDLSNNMLLVSSEIEDKNIDFYTQYTQEPDYYTFTFINDLDGSLLQTYNKQSLPSFTLNQIFGAQDNSPNRYHYFPSQHIIFDTITQKSFAIIEEPPLDFSNPSHLTSFGYGLSYFKVKHTKDSSSMQWRKQRQAIHPLRGIKKTNSITCQHAIPHAYGYAFPIVGYSKMNTICDYSFFKKESKFPDLIVYQLMAQPKDFSKEYFVGLSLSPYYPYDYTQIQQVQLSTLEHQISYINVFFQKVYQLKCDNQQFYIHAGSKNGHSFLAAVPFQKE